MKLEELIKQDGFADASQKVMLNILATSSWVTSQLSSAMSRYGVTPAQYNVLRILRGAYPVKMTCSEIGTRLLDRTPDVTRLLNRLETAGLIERMRSTSDRRVVEVGISAKGRVLLNAMDPEIGRITSRLSRHLSEEEMDQFNELIERYRADQLD